MDPAAIAETTVEMWCLIDAKLTARKQQELYPEIKATILKEAMSLYMTHIINEKQYGSTTPGETSISEPPTPKQRALIEKLGGDPSTIKTKRGASNWIEEHKDW